MTAYTPVVVSRSAGADMAAALTAVGGLATDTFAPGSDVYLRVKSTNASTVSVSVINASTVAGPRGTFIAQLALAPVVGATTGDRLYGPFPSDTFADPSDGQVHVTYSTTTNVTAGVFRMAG